MQELLVVSGKGGTGKTSLAASLAVLADNKVTVDCDVEAADLHLLLNPEVEHQEPFYGLEKAVILPEKCIGCGRCAQVCRFDAIFPSESGGVYQVDPLSCEGCKVCTLVCPAEAIKLQPPVAGYWYVSRTHYGPLVHAQLGIGEANSGKLVMKIKQVAQEVAREGGYPLILMDGPPGIGCPVIAAMTGSTLALAVTEPTVAGVHDLERLVRLARHFKVPLGVVINKYDLCLEMAQALEDYCRREGIEIWGKIPFDPKAAEAVVQGVPLVSYSPGPAAEAIGSIWERVADKLATSQ